MTKDKRGAKTFDNMNAWIAREFPMISRLVGSIMKHPFVYLFLFFAVVWGLPYAFSFWNAGVAQDTGLYAPVTVPVEHVPEPEVRSYSGGANQTLSYHDPLSSMSDGIIDIVLAMGIVGGMLAVFFGIATTIRRAVSPYS